MPNISSPATFDANADIWNMMRSKLSEALNANMEAEEFLFIFLLVALEGIALTLNSGNGARCQISPPPLPLMPMQIVGI